MRKDLINCIKYKNYLKNLYIILLYIIRNIKYNFSFCYINY